MLRAKSAVPTIPVNDIDRATKFYQDKFGYKSLQAGSDGVLLQGAGGCNIYLYETSAARGGHTLLSFEVDNLDEQMRTLRADGIVFEDYDMPNLKTVNQVADYEGSRSSWFHDSEGNILSLIEMSRDRTAEPVGVMS